MNYYDTNEKMKMSKESIVEICVNKRTNTLIQVNYATLLQQFYKYIYNSQLNLFLIYDEVTGAFEKGAEDQIKQKAQKQIPEYINSFSIKEIIEHIKRSNYNNLDDNEYKYLINLKNGVYDIKNKILLSHSPDYHFTYCLDFNFDEKAYPNKIIKFIYDIVEENMSDFITILEGISYLFIPGYPIRKSFMLVGNGANGKSTLLKMMTNLIGKKLVGNEDLNLLNDVGGFYLANIYQKWGNFGNDLPKKMLKETSNFKISNDRR